MTDTALAVLPSAPPAVISWPGDAATLMNLCRDLSHARTLPQWCQKSPADLFFAVQSFLRLRIDPFMGLRHVSIIRNNLFFDGQLCGAMLNNSGRLAGNIAFTYQGEGDDLTVTVTGRLANESEPRSVNVRLGDAKTDANENWRRNPEQQLAYNGVRKWGRRHCPEVLLGIRFTDEAADMIDVTPAKPAPAATVLTSVPPRSTSAEAEGGAETATTQEAQPFSVPRTDDDVPAWSSWATQLLAYVRAASTADMINEWITANAEHLAELQRFDSGKYRRLVDMINHQIAAKQEAS